MSNHQIIRYFFILWLLCFATQASAQSPYTVKGNLVDAASGIKLENATVSVLNAKDSILVNFAYAGKDGTFSVPKLRSGKFILLVSYPDYADYIQFFPLDPAKPMVDFGTLKLQSKANLIAEVVIKGKVPATVVNGDTLEYNAKAFVVEPNAKVEDILRQVPGMQIDNNGRITAYGQRVEKVLVEGEEFFGDDPTLVTKNLRADMVAKIQVFDKKSDNAMFTGIADGVKTKTINIKLKEDKKRGFFGNLNAGGATSDFYQAQGMLNLFTAQSKFAVFGNASNTGRTGLSSSEMGKYGMSNANAELVQGGIIASIGTPEEKNLGSDNYNGQGIPQSRTAGAHYDAKWNGTRNTINTNFYLGTLNVKGERNSLLQNNLSAGVLINNSDQVFADFSSRQKMDVTYVTKPDTTLTIKIVVDGGLKKTTSADSFNAFTLGGNNNLLNRGIRSLSNDGDLELVKLSSLFQKKLKKPGRTLALTLSGASNKNKTNGYLNAVNDFYNTSGALDSTQNINQLKTTMLESIVFGSNLAFTEKILKGLSLTLNYGLAATHTTSERLSFNQSPGGNYNMLDKKFSNNYTFDELLNKGGFAFDYNKDKDFYSLSLNVADVKFDQEDLTNSSRYKRNFFTWNPRATYLRSYQGQGWLTFIYFGRPILPTVEQLQPISINTDPLNIVSGNASLIPSFSHRLGMNFVKTRPLSGTSFTLDASYLSIDNPIVSSIVTDQAGKTTYAFVNLKEANTAQLNLLGYVTVKTKQPEINVTIELGFNNNTNFGYTNTLLNKRVAQVYSGGLSFSQYVAKKFNWALGVRPNYTASSSSLQNQLSNNGFGLSGTGNFSVNLPAKTVLSADAVYNYQAGTAAFNDTYEVLLINASLSKKFFEKENIRLMLSGKDLLNQNVGFSRNIFDTSIRQNSYTTIRRYFMFSLTWDFSKFGKTDK